MNKIKLDNVLINEIGSFNQTVLKTSNKNFVDEITLIGQYIDFMKNYNESFLYWAEKK